MNARTLIKEIEDWLAQSATQRFGQILIQLCEHPQCLGHKTGA